MIKVWLVKVLVIWTKPNENFNSTAQKPNKKQNCQNFIFGRKNSSMTEAELVL